MNSHGKRSRDAHPTSASTIGFFGTAMEGWYHRGGGDDGQSAVEGSSTSNVPEQRHGIPHTGHGRPSRLVTR